MSKGLLDLLFDSIFDENWVGKRGEKMTERELKLVQLSGRKGKVLRNVYLPKENGETSEVDVVFITQKGIFVFESKNYSGWIFGDEKSKNWTAMLPNRQKNQFYNPIMQNRTHLKWMRKYVGDDIPLFSIIVFSNRCELKKVTVYSEDVKVIKRDWTYAAVRGIWNTKPIQINQLIEMFIKYLPDDKVIPSVR
ncbi:MAG: NERD domain-containing protein [Lachnospiraceae bacterium]|nr:NERD domain-containing protein [Lachnospiraceae bacterium]